MEIKLIHQKKGSKKDRLSSYMECLIEYSDGRREYVSAKKYYELINGN